jgi:hydrogenase nickel incorporation protein HypA/HybF
LLVGRIDLDTSLTCDIPSDAYFIPMHEVAISEALLEQLASLAEQHGWSRLRRVWVRMGLLSGVVPEALEFAFSAMSPGTSAEGAELVLETVPGHFDCALCGALELDRVDFTCPKCGGPLQLVRAGRELYVSGVEPMDP